MFVSCITPGLPRELPYLQNIQSELPFHIQSEQKTLWPLKI